MANFGRKYFAWFLSRALWSPRIWNVKRRRLILENQFLCLKIWKTSCYCMSLGTHVQSILNSAQQVEKPKVLGWFCLHYYGNMDACLCNPYQLLDIFKAFLAKVLWVSVSKIFWHCKEMHAQPNLFYSQPGWIRRNTFSVCMSDVLHLVKIALNLVFPCVLWISFNWREKQTGWYRQQEQKSKKYLFNLKSLIDPVLFCLQMSREFVLIILIAIRAGASNIEK